MPKKKDKTPPDEGQATDKYKVPKSTTTSPLSRPTTEDTIITPLTEVRDAILSGWGSATVNMHTQVALYIKDVDKPIIFRPTREMLFGRGTGATDPLNLSRYNAAEMGVSRTHAALRRDDDEGALILVDLGSTNGTFLNEEQLSPNMPYTLHDGDAIRLGRLVMHLYFK